MDISTVPWYIALPASVCLIIAFLILTHKENHK